MFANYYDAIDEEEKKQVAPSTFLDTPEAKKEVIQDFLASKLPPGMRQRYADRKKQALELQNQSYQGPAAIESLQENASARNLAATLQKAANQFGTNPSDGQVSSKYNIDSDMQAQNELDASVFNQKQKMYNSALDEERQADADLMKFDEYNSGLEEKQANANWRGEQQVQQRLDWDRNKVTQDREDETYFGQKADQAELNDPNSEVSKRYQALATKLTGGKGSFEGMSASKLAKLNPMLTKAYEIDEKSRDRADLRNEKKLNREETRNTAIATKQAEHALKRQEKSEDDDKKRKEKYEKDSQEFNMRYDNINANLNELEDMIKTKGTYEMFGPHNDIMGSKLYQIAVDYAKVVDPASVAREGEVKAAEKYMLPIQGLGTKNSTALALIQKYKDDLAVKMKNKNANTYGAGTSAGQSKAPSEKNQSTANDDPFAQFARQ